MQMPKRLTPNWFGTLALAGAVVVTVLGFVIYRGEMGPHIFAAVAAVLAEAALVIFVLDRLTHAQKQREWAFVQRVVGLRMAACMVDIVRLCCVRWSSMAFASNINRYSHFVHIGQRDFGDLRSSIEGLALGAPPADYEFTRGIERRIHWIIDELRDEPKSPEVAPPRVLSKVLETHAMIYKYLMAESMLDAASRMVAQLEPTKSSGTATDDMNELFRKRMEMQQAFLDRWESSGHPSQGIWDDIDYEIASGYFIIDSVLFGEVVTTPS
jgi:hypothetical protein